MMRKYVEFTKSQLKLETAYVGWYWAKMASFLIQVVILYSLWTAVYEGREQIAGLSANEMLTYAIIAWLLGNYVFGVGAQLASDVRDGNVAVELLRPYDMLSKIVALDFGRTLSSIVRDALPVLLVAFLLIGISPPVSVSALLLFLLSAILGILIGAQLDLMIGVLSFYLVYVWGLRVLREAVFRFFTGALVPLALFPDWLLSISAFLPFQYMVHVPVSIYIGKISGWAAVEALALQCLWLVIVIVFIRVCWTIALRKVTVFGG
jgi:ABC-2 type transport system permease protein